MFLLLHFFLYLFRHFVFCFLITPLVSSNSSYYSQKSMTFFINISITCNFCVICKMQLKTFYINNTLAGFVTGSYPEITGVVNTLKACKVQFPDDCAETWDLEVKNCGSFMVFHLTFLESCSGRYCMGM